MNNEQQESRRTGLRSLTHVLRVRWNTGSSALCCPASAVCSHVTRSSDNPQTYCRCDQWPAASWSRKHTGDSGHAFGLKQHHSNENTITSNYIRQPDIKPCCDNYIWQSTKYTKIVLTSCCCPQRLQILECPLSWAEVGRLPPSSTLWTAPPVDNRPTELLFLHRGPQHMLMAGVNTSSYCLLGHICLHTTRY